MAPTPAISTPHSIPAGPIPLFPAIDVGVALGLPDTVLQVDSARTPVLFTLAQIVAVQENRQPLPRENVATPQYEDLARETLLGLPAGMEGLLAWRDEFTVPGSMESALARLLGLEVEALRAERDLSARAANEFGTLDAFLEAATAKLQGQSLAPSQQHALDVLVSRSNSLAGFEIAGDLAYQSASVAQALEVQAARDSNLKAFGAPARIIGPEGSRAWAAELHARSDPGTADRLAPILAESARLSGFEVAGPAPRVRADFATAVQEYARVIGFPLTADDLAELSSYESSVSPEVATLLATIVGAVAPAEARAKLGYAALTPSDIDFLSRYNHALVEQPPTAERPVPEGFELAEIADVMSRVDFESLWAASNLVTEAVETAVSRYEAAAQLEADDMLFRFPAAPSDANGGYLIQVGSPKADRYDDDATINIDLGGDDTYTAEIGGRAGSGGSLCTPVVSACVSGLGSAPLVQVGVDVFGDDLYASEAEFGGGAFGGGVLGVGVYLEFSGNDRYQTSGLGFSPALGAGYEGVGVFADYKGHDVYRPSQSFSPSLGGGVLGAGLFVEFWGDDVYETSDSETLGGGVEGLGIAVDLRGNDDYRLAGGCQFALGAGLIGAGSFHDGLGNDKYAKDTCFGVGDGLEGVGVFADTSGKDTYKGGAFLRAGSRKDDSPWVSGNLGVGIGIDIGSVVPQTSGIDLAARFTAPRNGFQVRPGGAFEFVVTVTNRGDTDLPQGSGTIEILDREDDTSAQRFRDVLQFPVPLVAKGKSVSIPVPWTAPPAESASHERLLYGVLNIAPPGTTPPPDPDFADFSVKTVPDLRLAALKASESGRLPPSFDHVVSGTIENRGNVPLTVPIRFLVETEAGVVSYAPAPMELLVPASGVIYDATTPAFPVNFTFAWTTPSTDGNYTVSVSFPREGQYTVACASDPSSDLCKKRTLKTEKVEIVTIIDGIVTPYRAVPAMDPDNFEGMRFRFANAGTVPFTGLARLTQIDAFGTSTVIETTITLPVNGIEVLSTGKPPVPPPPQSQWQFVAELVVPDESDESKADNRAEYAMKFIPNLVLGDDFEQPNLNLLTPQCNGKPNEWIRGKPRIDAGPLAGLKAHSGTSAWGTGLGIGFSNDRCFDLIYSNLDFTNYLDPYVEFWSAMHTLSCCGNFAFTGGHMSAQTQAAPGFQIQPVNPPYACQIIASIENGKPSICGVENWKLYRADLASFAGTVTDLRFRLASLSCCNEGWAGWFIDDLAVYGTRRLAGDIQVVSVKADSNLVLAGQTVLLTVTIRNNGFDAKDIPITLTVRQGTRDVVLTDGDVLAAVPGAQKRSLAFAWTPDSAARFSVSADLPTDGDPRPTNNHLDVALDVYEEIQLDDLESLPSPCSPGCNGWSHEGTPATFDEWQVGTPTDNPGKAASGTQAWATDLSGPYGHSPCCSDLTTKKQVLTTPVFAIPAAGHPEEGMEGAFTSPGDQYFLSFNHAYSTLRQGAASSNDLVFVMANRNDGEDQLLVPDAGHNTFTQFFDGSPCCRPNEDNRGWSGLTTTYEQALLPLYDVEPEDELRFKFVLWSHPFQFSTGNDAGWALDDVRLLRGPRFDHDLDVLGPSPRVYDIGSGDPLRVVVRNDGRETAQGALLHLRLEPTGFPEITSTLPVPAIAPGESAFLSFPIAIPRIAGAAPIHLRLEWAQDEWSHNDVFAGSLRFGRVIYQDDFETGDGGFRAEDEPGFTLGTRPDRSPLQGARSWSTGRLAHGQGATLTGPAMEARDPTGVELPKLLLTGLARFDAATANRLLCPYSGIRLIDTMNEEVLPMAPAPLSSITAFREGGHCGAYDPLEFEVDLTSRQLTDPLFQPEFQVGAGPFSWFCATCDLQGNNRGAEIDQLALFGSPHTMNALLRDWTSPMTDILGPGERAKLEVKVMSSGLQWPNAPVAVRFSSNDRAQNGGPSLDRVVPLPRPLEFAESALVSTVWLVPPALEDQVVRVNARLVVNTGCRCVNVADVNAADNSLTRFVSVVALHDLSLDLQSLPSLDPEQVVTTNLRATITNHGTLTEPAVGVSLEVVDDAGQVVRVLDGGGSRTIAPDFVQLPVIIEDSWLPAAPGHYRLRGTVSYAASGLDVRPEDNAASMWIHVGVPAFRTGDSFDADDTSWAPSGGTYLAYPFASKPVASASEGDMVLSTNAYNSSFDAGEVYRYDAPISLVAATGTARLEMAHSYAFDKEGLARLLVSEDQGASWKLLQPEGGYPRAGLGYAGDSGGWRAAQFSLAPYLGKRILVQFEFQAGQEGQAPGWMIDDIRAVTTSGGVLFEEGFENPLGSVLSHWDFETAQGDEQGWTHAATSTDADDWARGRPSKAVLRGAHSGGAAWVTGLRDPYRDILNTHRRLFSPSIEIPANADAAAVSWWQNYAIETGAFCCPGNPDPSNTDLAAFGVSVDGGPVTYLAPTNGYPFPVAGDSGTSRGFTGTLGGWELRTVDLSAYAGRNLRLVFDLYIAENFDQFFERGDQDGIAIDDVTVFARSEEESGSGTNVALAGVQLPLIGDYEVSPFTIQARNDAPVEQVAVLSWLWTGPRGTRLDTHTETVTLTPGQNTFSRELPAINKAQRALLQVFLVADGDSDLADNELVIPAHVQQILYRTDFENAAQASAWVASGAQAAEWDYGVIPSGKYPGAAASGDRVWATDLVLEDDDNLLYESNSHQLLTMPSFTVPAQGGVLRFNHAMNALSAQFADGGQVRIDNKRVTPIAGYTSSQCVRQFSSIGPCFTGTFGWREDAIPLDAYAGQSIQPQFMFVSDCCFTPNLAGWAIDDVSAAGNPPPATLDVGISAPAELIVDSAYGSDLDVSAVNLGTVPSLPNALRMRTYRDGALLSETLGNVPALPAGGKWIVPVALPADDLDGVVLRFTLEPREGNLPDDDPVNDFYETRVSTVKSSYFDPLEEGAAVPYQRPGRPQAFALRDIPANVPLAPSQTALIAGLGGSLDIPGTNPGRVDYTFELPGMHVPQSARLEFDHYYELKASFDGVVVRGTTDGARWQVLEPQGGYPEDQRCGWEAGSFFDRCFTGTAKGWSHVVVPLDSFAGQFLKVQFRMFSRGELTEDFGWAIDNLRIHGEASTFSFKDAPRWERGAITNRLGPIEAISLPNAWGVGLAASQAVENGWDVLEGPVIDVQRIPDPILSFDWAGTPESFGELSVQARDTAGNWIELGRITEESQGWDHAEFPLSRLGDETQVRFVYTTASGFGAGGPGYFIDDVLVGSLSAKLERANIVPDIFTVSDGNAFAVPVRITNTGSFTNSYRFTARGPDPYWYGNGTPAAATLEPGESRVVNVNVQSPFGGEAGTYNVLVVAQSLFDPLQRSVLRVPVDLTVGARPDWVVRNVVLTGVTTSGGVTSVPDATRVNVFADIQNIGDDDTIKRPRVQFLEHILLDGATGRTEVRAFNSSVLRPTPAPPPSFRNVPTDWTPRVGVIGLEILVNPGMQIPEKSPVGNSLFVPIEVKPRSLPELALIAEPSFSRLPHTGEATSVGLDVRNVGSSATHNPIDVSALANYEDATLTSPVVTLPGNDRLRIRYVADLELRVDGVFLEGRSGTGAWQRLEPEGGYPLGCVLAMRVPQTFGEVPPCQGGISGSTEEQVVELRFATKPMIGPSQFRLRFAMDTHNGRSPEGFTFLEAVITHASFGAGEQLVKAWRFGQSGLGWTPSHTWAFQPAEGPQPGGWRIPRDYSNPFTFGLRSAPVGQCGSTCLDVGQIAHVDMEWVPNAGGNVPITVYLDPHDSEPEFLDDANRYVTTRAVLDSDFVITPKRPLALPHATAEDTFPVTISNAGNHRAIFRLDPREHLFFEARLEWEGRPVRDIELDAGQSFDATFWLRATGAPAGTHTIVVDVNDAVSRKDFPFGMEVLVESGDAAPRVLGDLDFLVRQKSAHTLRIENAGNAFVPVVLRVGEKPSGLAARIQPDEFTLRPFEARSVQVEFINLGVAAGTYDVLLLNAGSCPSTAACAPLARLEVLVEVYAPPVAAFEPDAVTVGVGTIVRFVDESTSLGSTLVDWKWTFGDGATGTTSDAAHAYAQPGAYEVRLLVTDADGSTDQSDAVLIVVTNADPLAHPTVSLLPGILLPTRGVPLNLSAWESVDTDGGIVNVTWAFGDGQLGHGVNVSHVYQVAGNYRVTVAVEDSFGGVGVGILDLQVVEPIVDGPGLAAGEDESVFAQLPGPGLGVFFVAMVTTALAVAARRRRLGEE